MEWKDCKCIFCKEPAKQNKDYETDTINFDCPACGRFWITDHVAFEITDSKQSPTSQQLVNCAYHNAFQQRLNPKSFPIWVHTDVTLPGLQHEIDQNRSKFPKWPVPSSFETISRLPVNHAEKPMALLEEFANRLVDSSAFATFKVNPRDRVLSKIVDREELWILLEHLEHSQLISAPENLDRRMFSDDPYRVPLQLTVAGWEKVKANRERVGSRHVFIAMQFDWPGENDLRQQVLTTIQEACSACGYQADLVTQNHTGFITDRIIADIRKSRFVIADFTYNNRGAYFEAGFARGLGIPVYHTVRHDHVSGTDNEGKKVHFDIQQIRYLKWDTPDQLKQDLISWIEATQNSWANPYSSSFT